MIRRSPKGCIGTTWNRAQCRLSRYGFMPTLVCMSDVSLAFHTHIPPVQFARMHFLKPLFSLLHLMKLPGGFSCPSFSFVQKSIILPSPCFFWLVHLPYPLEKLAVAIDDVYYEVHLCRRGKAPIFETAKLS